MTRKPDKKTEYVTTRLPRDLAERLKEIGKAEDRTLSGVLRRLVTQALESQPVQRES